MKTFEVNVTWVNGFNHKYNITGNKYRPLSEGKFLDNTRNIQQWNISNSLNEIVLQKGDQYE